MSNQPHVTTEFRRYLLGELPEPARTAFEEAYFSDPELMEEIWAAETDLVDAYVTNRLDAGDRHLFESRYLTSPQRRERVAVARALQARIGADRVAPAPTAVPFRPKAAADRSLKPAPPPPLSTERPAAWRPSVWQWAAAAALLLAAATLAWLTFRPSVVLPPPSSASTTPAPPPSTPGPTTPKPAPPQTVPPGTTPPGATAPGTIANGPPPAAPPSVAPPPGGTRSPMVMLAVTLSPIQLRSDAGQTSVMVPPNTDRITLRFEGDRGAARDVAVDIRTVEGRRAWTGTLRIERPTPPGVAAAVTVPAKALPSDDYIATVFTIDPATKERTELNRYVFRIARKS